MSTSWARGVGAAALLLTGACGGSEPSAEPYSFRTDDTAVRVDSPQLREQKAAARIEACPPSEVDARAAANGLPDLTLPCLGGGRDVDLAGLRGTPLVLNFWSQTCGPCRTESPHLQQVHAAAGNRLRLLGIDWQDPRPSYAIAFARELGLTYPQIADPAGATRAPLRITALPITFFVDSDGRIVHTEYGPVKSAEDLVSLIAEHLHVSVPLSGA